MWLYFFQSWASLTWQNQTNLRKLWRKTSNSNNIWRQKQIYIDIYRCRRKHFRNLVESASHTVSSKFSVILTIVKHYIKCWRKCSIRFRSLASKGLEFAWVVFFIFLPLTSLTSRIRDVVKITCETCKVKGTLQKVGNNYYRIRHYDGIDKNRKPRFHYSSTTKEYAESELEKLRN